MKKVFYNKSMMSKVLFGTLLISTTFVGCQKDDNNIFDNDPIVRLDNLAKAELKQKLVDSENGWIVNFSPDGTESMGQFTMWFDFNDDWSLELKTDKDLNEVGLEKSQFNFVTLKTLALSFPLGNKVHEFTSMDPVNLRTDIEFVFSKYIDSETIEFQGHMTKQKIYFKKATAEEKKFQFSKRWELVTKLKSLTSASIVVNGRTTTLKYTHLWNDNNFRAGMVDKLGVLHYKATDDGKTVELLKPIEVAENDFISELILTGTSFVGKSTSGATLTLK